MNHEDTEKTMHEISIYPHSPRPQSWVGFVSVFARFASAVEAKEREACAKVCEEKHANGNYKHDTREECAEAIRARGEG